MIRFGVVENRDDPLKLGRCQVRIMGLHIADKIVLPTKDLPWALLNQPTTSAAMNGIGTSPVGLLPGTWVTIDFLDEDKQQPIIMGSIGGVPDLSNITSSVEEDSIILKDINTGLPEEKIGDGVDGGTPAEVQFEEFIGGGVPDLTTPPTVPPNNSVTNLGKSSFGIKAIISACHSNDYLHRNSVSAILGILSSNEWIPIAYPQIDLADPYFGRGFIPLVGEVYYKKYGALANVDILVNPELMVDDADIAARVIVAVIRDNMPKGVEENSIHFFDALARLFGYNNTNSYNNMKGYYEYFLGQTVDPSEGRKEALPEDIKVSKSALGITTLPGGDRNENIILGFSDPEGKYPLREYLHEPDTNRLARGQIDGTSIGIKDSQRVIEIPTAFGGTTSQPEAPYSASYPYNKVFESESGHVMEFDDTPQGERINMFHRSGTFTEVDSRGTQVNKIVGDGYTIIDRNGVIYIVGEANVTVDGNVNILCNSDANVEVQGNSKVSLRGNADIGVAKNANVSIGGNLNAKVVGNASLDIGGNMSTNVGGNFDLQCGNFNVSADEINLKASGNVQVDGALYFGQSGKATAASITPPSITLTSAVGEPKYQVIDYLESQPRSILDDFTIGEEPDEFDLESSATLDKGIVGDKSTPGNTDYLEEADLIDNRVIGTDVSCALIDNTETFQNSYVLSEKSGITIGTMIEVIGNCSIPQDAIISDSRAGPDYKITKQEVVCNLKGVAVNLLERIYEASGKDNIIISSSFRANGISKHSKNYSDHNKGRAIDIQLRGAYYDYKGHYDLAVKLQKILPYDQLILEYRDPRGTGTKRKVWLHISYRADQNRKMAFTMLNDSTYKRDKYGRASGLYLLHDK